MQIEIIDDTNPKMVRKKVERYLKRGWQKRGDIRHFESFIPYNVKITKHHKATLYYQELVKKDKAAL